MKYETPLFVILACVSSWAIITVLARVLLLTYGFAPATFVFIQMLAGGLTLVLLSHKRIKVFGLSPLKQLHTWGFGFFRVISASFYVGSLLYVSATNGAFLGATNVIMSVLFVWLILKRKPKLIELPGHLIILVGWYLLVGQLDNQFSNPAVWMMLFSQIIISFAIILAETHPMNQNNNSGDTLYLTGIILLASAIILLILSYLASIFEAQLPESFYPEIRAHVSNFMLQDIFNPYAWIFGIFMGAIFRAASIYYSLRAVKLTTTEFYLGSMSIMPFLIFGLEYIAMQLNYLPSKAFEAQPFILGSLMTLGCLYIIYFKRNK
ncbi:MAG: DMT family transporter [Rhizobiales bacterium]|nr:DMT family transporter [Hyphomicrobiales bacterium]